MGVHGSLVQGVYILTVSGVLSPFVSLGHKWIQDPWHCEDGVCIEAGDLVICFNS